MLEFIGFVFFFDYIERSLILAFLGNILQIVDWTIDFFRIVRNGNLENLLEDIRYLLKDT